MQGLQRREDAKYPCFLLIMQRLAAGVNLLVIERVADYGKPTGEKYCDPIRGWWHSFPLFQQSPQLLSVPRRIPAEIIVKVDEHVESTGQVTFDPIGIIGKFFG